MHQEVGLCRQRHSGGGLFPGVGEGKASAKGRGGASTFNSYEIPRGRGIPVPIPGCLATPGGTVVIGDATTVIGVRAGAVGPWADVDRGRGETIAKSRSIAAISSLAIAARWSVVRRPGSWEEGMGGAPAVEGAHGQCAEINKKIRKRDTGGPGGSGIGHVSRLVND